jgi:hypothetical protein
MRDALDWPSNYYHDTDSDDDVNALARRMLSASAEEPDIELITVDSAYAAEESDDEDDSETEF